MEKANIDQNNKVNVFCIGAAKSGTTSIYYFLRQYNHLGLSRIEEVDYFSKYFNEWSQKTYEDKFDKVNKNCIIDISPSYLSDPDTPKRIYNYNPNAQIIVVLIEPISRMLSHMKMHLRSQNISSFTIENIDQLRNTRYYEDSRYVRNIQRYKKYFKGISIFQMEELNNNKNEFNRFKELFKIYDNKQFPHVHSHGYKPLIPFYYSFAHGINRLSKKYFFFNALKKIVRKNNLKRHFSRRGNIQIFMSEEVKESLEKEFRGDVLLWKLAKNQ